MNANGKIDSDAADRDWARNTDASRVAVNVMAAAQQSIQLSPPSALESPTNDEKPDADDVGGNDRVANEYREHRATRERFQALKQQLEYEQLVGQLINVDEAKRIAYTAFRGLRDAVMNVAPRIKDQIAAISDPHEVEQILERELAAALGGVDVGRLLKDQDQDD